MQATKIRDYLNNYNADDVNDLILVICRDKNVNHHALPWLQNNMFKIGAKKIIRFEYRKTCIEAYFDNGQKFSTTNLRFFDELDKLCDLIDEFKDK